MKASSIFIALFIAWAATTTLLVGCKKTDDSAAPPTGTHVHEDGSVHTDHGTATSAPHDDAHEEFPIGTVTIAGMQVELAQGHGTVEAGKESHLVVKLPYSDSGQTTVRAWIGTEDRTASYVGKGLYAPAHDDYDIHAMAGDPLPANAMWWIEIEKPDGTRVVGSAKPL